MNYSLVDHNRNYQITGTDLVVSLATGLSGAPYAIRHHQLSEVENVPKWGHRIICLVEFVPVLGAMVAMVERVFYSLFSSGHSDVPWRAQSLSPEEAMDRMARWEHFAVGLHEEDDTTVFANRMGVTKQLTSLFGGAGEPVQCKHQVAEAKGPRTQMEDAHFYLELDGGILAGVFDGHGGKEVSSFAAEQFKNRFPKALKDAGGNVHTAFETLIHHIHQDIASRSSWNDQGSTAVVSYIDTKKGLIYTATLGDSEANLYRNNLIGSVTSIPLSVVSDWFFDKGRLVKVFGELAFWRRFFSVGGNVKRMRSRLELGVNVSRALGDVSQMGVPSKPLVTHEPMITIQRLKAKDVVVLACDGLKDFVPEREVADTIAKTQSVVGGLLGRDSRPLAQQLVDKALQNMNLAGDGDNVTVLAIEVKKASS